MVWFSIPRSVEFRRLTQLFRNSMLGAAMKLFAISDLHLSLGGEKPMDIFGPEWANHADKVRRNWDTNVGPDDVVLLPGDHSWALKLEDAAPDLEYLARRPGTKILIRGNHDYWWHRQGTNKLRKMVGQSIVLLHRNSVTFGSVGIAGTRGWRLEEAAEDGEGASDGHILARELTYLRESLDQIADAEIKIAMLHYPPFSVDLEPTEFAGVLREYGVNILVYGHVHSGGWLEGKVEGIEYHLVAADRLGFAPKLIHST